MLYRYSMWICNDKLFKFMFEKHSEGKIFSRLFMFPRVSIFTSLRSFLTSFAFVPFASGIVLAFICFTVFPMFFFEFRSWLNINIYKSNTGIFGRGIIRPQTPQPIVLSLKIIISSGRACARDTFVISEFVFMAAKFFNRFLLLAGLTFYDKSFFECEKSRVNDSAPRFAFVISLDT